jgi:hypothetical protein
MGRESGVILDHRFQDWKFSIINLAKDYTDSSRKVYLLVEQTLVIKPIFRDKKREERSVGIQTMGVTDAKDN